RGEGDAPEVGRAGPRVSADDLEFGLGFELRAQPDAFRDGEIARDIAGQLLERLVLGFDAAFETRPVRRDRDPALAPGRLFDEHAKVVRHGPTVAAAGRPQSPPPWMTSTFRPTITRPSRPSTIATRRVRSGLEWPARPTIRPQTNSSPMHTKSAAAIAWSVVAISGPRASTSAGPPAADSIGVSARAIATASPCVIRPRTRRLTISDQTWASQKTITETTHD